MIFIHPFWGAFFGVFSGIIAGVAIYLIIGQINRCILKRNAIANLKFEIEYNIKHIDFLLKELQKFRNKVNADSIESYYGTFPLSKIIMTQVAQMFLDRSIYKYLKHEDIGKLQTFSKYFTIEGERTISEFIKYYKANYKPEMKKQISKDIEDFEKILEVSKVDLQSIQEKFK